MTSKKPYAGETDLKRLLENMNPVMDSAEYVFCTQYSINENFSPLGLFKEAEGWTMILDRSQADRAGIPYDVVFNKITLNIHSSLEAIGFTSAIAAELTKHGIPANIVAAFYHDHLFIPIAHAADCMQILLNLKENSGK
ncbi:MAG: ACT domain-containing protein [Calditrichaceae bacterium]|nr:ACT domain-containing protein [Calditrichaceae bacterium]MBN2709652.1 ACT domain-containing protein [Calditrichaceae bacterium]RQV92447.1 MAG: ACT domain-containing protein [Calditrichota bacterium]